SHRFDIAEGHSLAAALRDEFRNSACLLETDDRIERHCRVQTDERERVLLRWQQEKIGGAQVAEYVWLIACKADDFAKASLGDELLAFFLVRPPSDPQEFNGAGKPA